MRKEYWLIIILGIIIVALLGILAWPNQKNKSQKPPAVVFPEGLEIISPKVNEEISSPLKISGSVSSSSWAPFEAQAGTVRLFDSAGKELALGILTTPGDWMKLPTNFETVLNFTSNADQLGTLVFKNENASGDTVRDKEFALPVKIKKTSIETMTVKVFFGKTSAENDCNAVFPVERTIQKTDSTGSASLMELFKGPTEAEKSAGYYTSINQGVRVQSLIIGLESGTARADFNEKLQEQVGGSCRVAAIRAQIIETLKQWPTIKSVVISINGRTEDILQP